MGPFVSFLVGAGIGYVGAKLLKKNGNNGVGVIRFYPHLDNWDSELKAKAIMQSLAGVPPGIMGDMPHSFYGGAEGLPSFSGDPTFLTPYDPDGPKDTLWHGFPWDGFPVGGLNARAPL